MAAFVPVGRRGLLVYACRDAATKSALFATMSEWRVGWMVAIASL